MVCWVSVCRVLCFYRHAGCQYVECWPFIGILGVRLQCCSLLGVNMGQCCALLVCWVSVCGVLAFEWHAGCQYAECCAFIIMLSFRMLNVTFVSVHWVSLSWMSLCWMSRRLINSCPQTIFSHIFGNDLTQMLSYTVPMRRNNYISNSNGLAYYSN